MVNVALVINEKTVTSIPLLLASWLNETSKVNVDVIEISRTQSTTEKIKKIRSLRGYDITHTNQNYSGLWVTFFYLYSLIIGRKITAIHTLHSNLNAFNLFQKIAFYLCICPLRDFVIVNSKSTLQSINVSKVREKVKIISHAVDATGYQKKVRRIGSGPIKLLMVGRLVPVKNHFVVLRAVRLLKKMNIECNLTICGAGIERSAITEFIYENNLKDSVFLTGELPRDQVMHLMQESHFMVVASFNEGFGVATIEAMFSGCLPICSDIVINREIVGLESVFFDPNSAYDLAVTIKYFLDNKSIYEENVSSLHNLSAAFQKSTCVNNYAKLYTSLRVT